MILVVSILVDWATIGPLNLVIQLKHVNCCSQTEVTVYIQTALEILVNLSVLFVQ